MSRRLLLLSNGSELISPKASEFAYGVLKDFFGTSVKRVLFVPFATVMYSQDDYLAAVRKHFGPLGYEVSSLHTATDPRGAIERTDAIAVGGGNTFKLLSELYRYGVVETIRERVMSGMPYVGWSAGSNVACPTIRTTNDMPILEPPTLNALGLVPFQINPHYTDARLDGHMGETRDERLLEFTSMNPGIQVIGIREGTMLRIEGDDIKLLGDKPARLFVKGEETRDIPPEESFSFLLR